MKEEFDKIMAGAIFRKGILPNSPEGIFMTRSGGNFRWLAKKGWANDWTIYCHWDYHTDDFVEQNGDKVTQKAAILRCIPECEDIFNLYRY